MRVAVRDDHSVVLGNLADQHLIIIGLVPNLVAAGTKPQWEHDPTDGRVGEEWDELREDWKLIVEPELKAHCEGELAVLLADLAMARPQDTGGMPAPENVFQFEDGRLFEIHIPPDHVEAWYGALNQVRLALESLHGFAAARPDIAALEAWPVDKQFAFWQYRLYSAIQEGLLVSMENMHDSRDPGAAD